MFFAAKHAKRRKANLVDSYREEGIKKTFELQLPISHKQLEKILSNLLCDIPYLADSYIAKIVRFNLDSGLHTKMSFPVHTVS